MRWPEISQRDRRALTVGAVILVTGLALGRGIPALRTWTLERQASALELGEEVRSLRHGIASQRARKSALRERSVALAALDGSILPGATPASASASLARLVGSAAEASGIHVRSAQVRNDSVREGRTFARVAVRADAVGDIRGLTSWLARLERGPELLVVRSLSVTQPEPSAEMEELRVELEIVGLARSGAGCACSASATCRCGSFKERAK